jgi:amino acid permease
MMGILAATTVGAGIFTLPWIFHNAGWLRATGWMIGLSALVIFAMYSYWKTLEAVDERERMVALARRHLGKGWGALVLAGVLGGMLFILIIYLVLAQRFFAILLPVHGTMALLIFWALAVLPATFSINRFAIVETAGSLVKGLLMLFVFFSATRYGAIFESSVSTGIDPLLPFGAILFSLSGWTAIEPMYELWRGRKDSRSRPSPLVAIGGGILLIATLYFLFSAGILGSLTNGSFLSVDTLSGLAGWPFWRLGLLAALGIFALWTAYGPTALEFENALRHDLRWNPIISFAIVAILPLLIVFTGLVNIIQAITFAGAIFVGLQYMTIFALAEKVLRPRTAVVWAMRAAALVFAFAAVYEIYRFMVN